MIRVLLSASILLALLPFAVAAETLSYMVYGTAGEPFQIIDRDGRGSGIITDLVHRIFDNSEHRVLTVVQPVNRAKRAMRLGEVKNWIGYGFRSWQQDHQWGQHHFIATDLFYYRYSLMFISEDQAMPRSLKAIEGCTLVTIRGFEYRDVEPLLEGLKYHKMEAENQLAALNILERGRGDFFLGNTMRARYVRRKAGGNWAPFSVYDLLSGNALTLMVDKNMPSSLKSFIEQRVAELVANGEMAEIIERYKTGFSQDP